MMFAVFFCVGRWNMYATQASRNPLKMLGIRGNSTVGSTDGFKSSTPRKGARFGFLKYGKLRFIYCSKQVMLMPWRQSWCFMLNSLIPFSCLFQLVASNKSIMFNCAFLDAKTQPFWNVTVLFVVVWVNPPLRTKWINLPIETNVDRGLGELPVGWFWMSEYLWPWLISMSCCGRKKAFKPKLKGNGEHVLYFWFVGSGRNVHQCLWFALTTMISICGAFHMTCLCLKAPFSEDVQCATILLITLFWPTLVQDSWSNRCNTIGDIGDSHKFYWS